VSDVGAHKIELGAIGETGAPIVTRPPDPVATRATADGEAAFPSVNWIAVEVELVEAEIVKFAVARVPSEIEFLLRPITIQTYWVAPIGLQLIVFPDAEAAGPAVTLTAVMSTEENEKTHISVETWMPLEV
jgi:hypothetical protein